MQVWTPQASWKLPPQYGNKARADSIALVVMDEKNRRDDHPLH